MRISTALLSGALFAMALASPAFADTKTVTGKLVDLSCYGQDKDNTGNMHKGKGYNCGKACAREGFPVGVLTSDGKVYQITGALAGSGPAGAQYKLVPHIGETVTVSGDVTDKGGISMISATDFSK